MYGFIKLSFFLKKSNSNFSKSLILKFSALSLILKSEKIRSLVFRSFFTGITFD